MQSWAELLSPPTPTPTLKRFPLNYGRAQELDSGLGKSSSPPPFLVPKVSSWFPTRISSIGDADYIYQGHRLHMYIPDWHPNHPKPQPLGGSLGP